MEQNENKANNENQINENDFSDTVELEVPELPFNETREINTKGKKKSKGPRKVSLGLTIVLVLFTALFTFQTTYVTLTTQYKLKLNEAKATVSKFGLLLEAYELFAEKCVYDIDDENLINYMLYAFSAEDKYSSYLTPEEFDQMYMESYGNASGIGIYVSNSDEGIRVAHIMAGSPAEAAGLQYNDCIVAVSGQRVSKIGYNEAVTLVSGEKGTDVVLTVWRDGKEIDVAVTRGDYTPETVVSSVIEENGEKLGYIRIIQFDQITVTQFKTAVEALLKEGCEKLVFDVRDNPGGELSAIVEILDYLLPKGPIIRLLDADKNETQRYTSDKNEVDMPMVVLTSENTASAAELFTSALRDYEKAVIIGKTTYGKGCGQSYQALSNGGYISITTFYYNPPFGDNYDGVGITPNIEVELPEEYQNENLFFVPYESDTQLKAAVAYLTK